MKASLIDALRCPRCEREGALQRTATSLICECAAEYTIRGAIPRFVTDDNYTSSFGFQWNLHACTQLDRTGNAELSKQRFFGVTGWPDDLRGQRLLEAGSGAGRFTAVAASTGAEVYSFDYSTAVDANFTNNGERPNVNLLQGDIYRIPLRRGWFDKVMCLGVLQHCPDPKRAFQSLVPHLAPGGQIVIDVYKLTLRTIVHPKYLLRTITTRIPHPQLHRAVELVVPVLLPLKRWLADRVPLGEYLSYFVPVAYQREWRAHVDAFGDQHLRELSILDTFDWYSPAYDKPQTLSTVRAWFHEAGLEGVDVRYGPNGIIGRATRPAIAHEVSVAG